MERFGKVTRGTCVVVEPSIAPASFLTSKKRSHGNACERSIELKQNIRCRYCTMTSPLIDAPWIVQWYLKLPLLANVRLNVPASCDADMTPLPSSNAI